MVGTTSRHACRDATNEALQQVAERGLISKCLGLVDVSTDGSVANHLSTSAFFLLLGSLTTCAHGSASLVQQMLHGQLHIHMHELLASSGVALANNRTTSAVKSQPQLLQARTPSHPLLASLFWSRC